MTYADILQPTTRTQSRIYDAVLIVTGSLLIACSAQLIIPLPFTPVPLTGQTFGVLIIAALLGSRRGVLAVITYLLEGFAGLPFFAGGVGGAAILFGPNGGYLIGFIFSALVVGLLAERGWDRRFRSAFFMMCLGVLPVYGFGALWLARFTGAGHVFYLGILPFLPGGLIKISAATLLLPSGWKLLRKSGLKKD